MRNFIQPGHSLDLTVPAPVLSGSGILIGSIFGVCATDALSGATVAVSVEGVFTLPKASGAVTVGQPVFWDNTAKLVTTVSTANTRIGVATAAAATGDATVPVRLNGNF